MSISRLSKPKIALLIWGNSPSQSMILGKNARELICDRLNCIFTFSRFGQVANIRVLLLHDPHNRQDYLWLCFESNIREQLANCHDRGFTLNNILESVVNQLRLLSGVEFSWAPIFSNIEI